jgi:hypothetical protein
MEDIFKGVFVKSAKKSLVKEIQLPSRNSNKITNFPGREDNKVISLQNSNFRVFDSNFALEVKNNRPELWSFGVQTLTDTFFDLLIEVVNNNGTPQNLMQEKAILVREAYGARHFSDFILDDVIKQVKFLVIGSRGEIFMKDVINNRLIGDASEKSLDVWGGILDPNSSTIQKHKKNEVKKEVALDIIKTFSIDYLIKEII